MPRSKLYPPSVRPGIPKLGPCPPGWRTVKLRELFDVMSRPADLVPDRRYQLVTVKRSRGGVVAREELRGDEIKTPTQFYVKEGDFVISRRQIIHGACGFVPAELDGAVVSNEYDVLRPRLELVPGFLRELVHIEYMQRTFFQSSVGVDVEKMVFDLDWWLGYPVHLAPIAEQQGIAQTLRDCDRACQQSDGQCESLRSIKQALSMRLFRYGPSRQDIDETGIGPLPSSWAIAPLRSLLKGPVKNGTSPEPARSRTGLHSLTLGALGDTCFESDAVKDIVPDPTLDAYLLNVDDFLVSRSNTPDRVGRVARFRGEIERCIYPDLMIRLQPDSNMVDLDYLEQYLRSTEVQHNFRRLAAGTSGSMVKITGKVVEELLVPLPSRAEQIRIGGTLLAADVAIARCERARDAQSRLKHALQQSLLSGRLRVKV